MRAMFQPYWFFALAAPLALYIILLLLLSLPPCQRFALYANNFSTSWIDDLDSPEDWGFAKNQVTPFYVTTHDGVRLHAWHILPRALYARHEAALANEVIKKDTAFQSTFAYRLLTDTVDSKLILNPWRMFIFGDVSGALDLMLEGFQNAGHLLQHHRPEIYRSLSTIDENAHLIVFSYRGFGRSSGAPTEAGLITDGIAITEFAMNDLGIAPANIALIGQSLGTAVVSAVTDFYSTSAPTVVELNLPKSIKRTKVDFATVVLVAAFSDLRTLLLKYKIAGYVSILAPIAWIPGVPRLLGKIVHEPWDTKARISRIVQEAFADVSNGARRHLNLQILHALDDGDIPYQNSHRVYDAALDAAIREVGTNAESLEQGVELEGSFKRDLIFHDIRVSLRLLRRGGHNEITFGTDVAVAIARGFGLVDSGSQSSV